TAPWSARRAGRLPGNPHRASTRRSAARARSATNGPATGKTQADLRKAPALTETRRLEVLVGFLVVGEDALLAVPLQLAFEIERHNAQQHSLGERRCESEVRHGSRDAPLAGHDPLRVVPWRAPQDLGRQLSIPHPPRRQQGDAAFGSFTASRQIALVADKND